MKNNKILLYLMIIISIILCIPSIIYLIVNGSVEGFNSYYSYTLTKANSIPLGLLNGIIIISLLLLFSIIYLMIIKKEKSIFKNKKSIIIFIAIISFIFMIILPYLSSDIYYYIGDSWLNSKYGENPYYTTINDLSERGITDEILNNTGYWKWRSVTSTYGPVWNFIASILSSLSFGKITIALFIFKISSLVIHILNSYIFGKLTNSRKYILLYGLNPLVLLETLSNVHNDIYLIFFILIALYFFIRKKNIILTIIFLALSIATKYSTVLIVPFILIYYFRKYNIGKKLLYCILSGISIITIVILLYLPYYRDMSVFTNMLEINHRYSQSILALLYCLSKCNHIFIFLTKIKLPIFALFYISIILHLLVKKNLSWKYAIKKYNIVMLVFIFLILTTFQKWYILWLLPTIIWQNRNMRKIIIFLTIIAIIPSLIFFMIGNDNFYCGMFYSSIMIYLAIMYIIIVKILNINKKRRIKCQD